MLNEAQVVHKAHPRSQCEGRACVLHNPSAHHMASWSLEWDQGHRRMMRMCPHGITHPDPDGRALDDAHNCDGCCVAR